jgi:hypothetical protein
LGRINVDDLRPIDDPVAARQDSARRIDHRLADFNQTPAIVNLKLRGFATSPPCSPREVQRDADDRCFIFPPPTVGPSSFRVTPSPRPTFSSCSNNSNFLIQGSKDLAAKLGVPLKVVQSNGSSQTELAGIQAQWPKNASRSDDPLFAERASQARPLKANAYESIASRSKRTTIKPLFVRRLLCPAILALSIRPGLYANIIFFRMAYGCVCGTMPLYATQLTSANFKILKRT